MPPKAAALPAPDQLAAVAARLTDIAETVARDAEAATADIRGVADHAHQIAAFATELAAIAGQIEEGVAAQRAALAAARQSLTDNEPAIRALAGSIESVAAISTMIAGIASESCFLSLNAQIEAARAGTAGAGFVVVAREMSLLAERSRSATGEIGSRASAITRDAEGAQAILLSSGALIAQQDSMLAASLDMAGQQRGAAAAMSRITGDTAQRIDDAAARIGRVASAAVATRLLARQIARSTGG